MNINLGNGININTNPNDSYVDRNGNWVTRRYVGNSNNSSSGSIYHTQTGNNGSPIIFIVIGVALAIGGGFFTISSFEGGDWPTTDATVTYVSTDEDYDCTTDSDGWKTCRTDVYYIPTISYKVDGQEHNVRAEALKSLNKMSVGDRTVISYNPDDPSSVSSTSSRAEQRIGGIIATLIGVIFAAVGIVSLRKKKASSVLSQSAQPIQTTQPPTPLQ